MFYVIIASEHILYTVVMKKRIEFFLYPEMLALDVTGPLDVFHAANGLLSDNGRSEDGYEMIFSAIEPGSIPTSSGLQFHADNRLGGEKTNILVVPGGRVAESLACNSVIVQAVFQAAQKSERIVSICTGAFLLAAAGLLDGCRATTHWSEVDLLAERYPEVSVEPDAIYVQDGNIATSAGVTAGIDLALALLEDDYGADIAIEVARILLLYRRRPGNQSQFSTPLALQTKVGKRFRKLIDWIETHLDQDLTVERLAEQVHMSPRTFARVFPSETGISPGRFIEQLRIDCARELLESGTEGLEYIALESGFGREERLRRAFQRRLGISPAQYRAHFKLGGTGDG